MLESIRSHTEHTVLGIFVIGIPSILEASIDGIVHRTALSILVVISLPLLYLHNNLFACGFVIGFVFEDRVHQVVARVNMVYDTHRSFLERFALFGVGGFVACYSMPVSLVVTTLYYSAKGGALLSKTSYDSYKLKHPELFPDAEDELLPIEMMV